MGEGEPFSNDTTYSLQRHQDFIILSIVPPGSHSSPFLELRTLVPIRLVTDPQNSDTEFVAPEWMDRDEKGGL